MPERYAPQPMMGGSEICALALSGAAAGVINAVAGGGTLLTFPTLLFFGTPPVIANATSTLALVIGTAGSLYGFRSHLESIKPWLSRFMPVSVLGGLIGSALLTWTSNKTFARLVPFLILFATLLFLTQGLFRRLAGLESKANSTSTPVGAILFQFLVAIYGGYFGAGCGILMLATLAFLGFNHIHEMNALKTLLGSLINAVAAVWFICAGLIHWPKAGIMTVGAVAGYFLGSHYSQQIPQGYVRRIITAIGFILSAVTFYKQFGT